MMKIFLCGMMGIIIAMFVFGTSPAHAILGIRAAKTVMAARKAKQMTSSSSSTYEEAYAQEKAKFGRPASYGSGTSRTAESSTSNILKNKERP